jgi:uncharacterized protein YrzB (UPF0473 family)
MGEYKSNEMYMLELYGRGRSSNNQTTYIDLIVYHQKTPTIKDVYLVNTINTETKQKAFIMEMMDVKTGSVHRAEGNSRAEGHESYNIFTPNKNFYDTFESKVDDMMNVLFIAKCAKPNPKARQEWQREEEIRVANGQAPRQPDPELILAWDGDYRKQLYQVLNDRYNTPMLEEWKDYIIDQCIELGYYKPLIVKCYGNQYDLEAGLLSITEKQLEDIISEGIRSYELNFAVMEDGRSEDESVLKHCTTLDAYLEHFAGDLGQRIQENSKLRFDPTKEKHHKSLYHANLHANKQGITGLFPPQADVVMGCAKTLLKDKYVFVIGEMGSGKSPMGATIPYVTHAMRSKKEKPDPYRALVFVPSIMVDKWKREIKERVPGAKVYQISHWTDVKKLEKAPYKPTEIEYYVMSSDAAKQTYPLEPVVDFRIGVDKDGEKELNLEKYKDKKKRIRFKKETYWRNGQEMERRVLGPTGMYCPQCGNPLMATREKVADEHFYQIKRDGKYVNYKGAENYKCRAIVETAKLPKEAIKDPNERFQECGYVLWQPKLLKPESLERKVAPAWYINKRLKRGFFEYLIADEVHEYKSGDSDRANAFGQLINHTNKQILLTGTLLGGMASDIFYLLARLDPKKLLKESITYRDEHVFIERYGVYENTTQFRGGRQQRKKKKQPGVSPQVFPRFLMSNCAFIELADLGYALPPYREIPIFVDMDEEHKYQYDRLEEAIGSAMRLNVARGGMKHVSTYVTKLYQYADMPFNHGPIMYTDSDGNERMLAQPFNFNEEDFTPTKYFALKNLLDEQIDEKGRKVLVYARFTGDKAGTPVDLWLYRKLKEDGYNVGILRSSGSVDGMKMPKQEDREAWLRDKMERYDWDILITNSRLVAVGLDLLMFPHICFYQMDYSAYNYMQASRRSWRIKQTQDVEVSTLVYRDTIQADVLENIAKKIDAAMALQGKFSEEGLRAMADSADGINALAKKLMNEGRLDNINSIEDRWKRINASYEQLQNSRYEGYEDYEMNPLGMEEVRRIQQGLVAKMRDDVAAGKITARDLEDYLAHIEDMFIQIENVDEYNRGVKKKDRIVEGQAALALF